MRSAVAVHAGVEHYGLVALLGIGCYEAKGYLQIFLQRLHTLHLVVGQGDEHDVGLRGHASEALGRQTAGGDACRMRSVILVAAVVGQRGDELRSVVDGAGEGIFAGLGIVDGELVAAIIIDPVDTLDARAPLAVLEGRMLEVEAYVYQGHDDILSCIGHCIGRERRSVQQVHARHLARHVGLQSSFMTRIDATDALYLLQGVNTAYWHADDGLPSQFRLHLDAHRLHLPEGGSSIFLADLHHQRQSLFRLRNVGASRLSHGFRLAAFYTHLRLWRHLALRHCGETEGEKHCQCKNSFHSFIL